MFIIIDGHFGGHLERHIEIKHIPNLNTVATKNKMAVLKFIFALV